MIAALVLILFAAGLVAVCLFGTVERWTKGDPERVTYKTLDRVNKTHPHEIEI